jgi:hypothetical protein
MNRLKNRINRLRLIYGDEPIGKSDAELNSVDDEIHLSDFLDQAEEIYDASLEDIIDAIKHSSVCQLEKCENKLCTLFKRYCFIWRCLKDVGLLDRVVPLPFVLCVQFHKLYLCKDEMCPIPDCWKFKQLRKTRYEIRDYYANENRDISKDYNNNDE